MVDPETFSESVLYRNLQTHLHHLNVQNHHLHHPENNMNNQIIIHKKGRYFKEIRWSNRLTRSKKKCIWWIYCKLTTFPDPVTSQQLRFGQLHQKLLIDRIMPRQAPAFLQELTEYITSWCYSQFNCYNACKNTSLIDNDTPFINLLLPQQWLLHHRCFLNLEQLQQQPQVPSLPLV